MTNAGDYQRDRAAACSCDHLASRSPGGRLNVGAAMSQTAARGLTAGVPAGGSEFTNVWIAY